MPYESLDALWDLAHHYGAPNPTFYARTVVRGGKPPQQEWVVTLVLPDGAKTYAGNSADQAAWMLLRGEFPDPMDQA